MQPSNRALTGSLFSVLVVGLLTATLAPAHATTAAQYLALPRAGGLTTPKGAVGGANASYAMYRCKDGRVAVASLEPHFERRLTEIAQRAVPSKRVLTQAESDPQRSDSQTHGRLLEQQTGRLRIILAVAVACLRLDDPIVIRTRGIPDIALHVWATPLWTVVRYGAAFGSGIIFGPPWALTNQVSPVAWLIRKAVTWPLSPTRVSTKS